MLMNEFCPGYFKPRDEQQENLFKQFIKLRSVTGTPSRFKILRNLAKTRKTTKTIYPPDWHFS